MAQLAKMDAVVKLSQLLGLVFAVALLLKMLFDFAGDPVDLGDINVVVRT